MSLNPKTRKLHEAITEFCELTGVNAASISVITDRFVGLLAARWEHICDAANDDENEGKIDLTFKINLDLTAKCPCGNISLAFTPQRIKDPATFNVSDPEQTILALDGGANPPRRPRRGRRPRATVITAPA